MNRTRSFLRKLFRCEKGNVMLEFAIGSGVMMAAFGGTFQFGYTFYQYNLLRNAVAAGARYASVRPFDSATCTASSTFSSAIKNVVVYGDPSGGTSPVAPNLATTNVNLTPVCVNGVPTAMTVSLSGYTISAVFGSTTLTNKPTVTYSYTGIWSPY